MTESRNGRRKRALVIYPESESYTTSAVEKAFKSILPDWEVCDARENGTAYDLQLCDYDELDWDMADQPGCLSNAYMLRKALIRKSYLGVTVAHHLSKNPTSILSQSIPKTYPFQIAHADELDELFYDELYDLGQALDKAEDDGPTRPWWILKPAMADKGQGIRLFDSRESLQAILESFEDDSDDEEEEESGAGPSTKISLSTMRDWVIQEYIADPLLIDPLQGERSDSELQGRKFHLRVYVLAVGALQVYVYTDILALFASQPYEPPSSTSLDSDGDEGDPLVSSLAAHLTNTCLQTEGEAESSVFLLSDLVGKTIFKPVESVGRKQPTRSDTLSRKQMDRAIDTIGQVVGETFKAALGQPNHFAVSKSSFEVFGVDLLLSLPETNESNSAGTADEESDLNVHLLEVNACPDFKQSGEGLHEVIGRLFEGVLEVAVKPFFAKNDEGKKEDWEVGSRKGRWLKCLDLKAGRSARPW